MDLAQVIRDWPGKSADDRGIAHPAVYHMLDVAAVAERLLAPMPLDAPLRDVLKALYATPPSLVLAHGRAAQSDAFRAVRDAHALNPADEPGPTDWLADSRRRALLADIGVGTVDQAHLGVVRARHAPLRLFGLASKILIVDEVHEMGDPYMGRLLEELLHAQAALGGSASAPATAARPSATGSNMPGAACAWR